jgi:tellurite resistance protein TerC
MDRFRYLKTSLVLLLAFVGVKMILSHHWPIPTTVSLAVIAGILAAGVVASFAAASLEKAPLRPPVARELGELASSSSGAARKIAVLVVGSTLLLIGAALLVLPGPALPVLFVGLLVLGTEFLWARRLLKRLKTEVESITRRRPDRKAGKGQGAGPTA